VPDSIVVGRAIPFHCTTEVDLKFVPRTESVKASPGIADEGVIFEIVGPPTVGVAVAVDVGDLVAMRVAAEVLVAVAVRVVVAVRVGVGVLVGVAVRVGDTVGVGVGTASLAAPESAILKFGRLPALLAIAIEE
jgi:hypothetical protein